MISEAVAKRLWDDVEIHDNDDCWPYMGKHLPGGYGFFYMKGRHLTHRLSYELHFGEIPNGLFVLHKCDNPPCCNPNHLWIGTKGDNNRDMHKKGRSGWNGWTEEAKIKRLRIGTANNMAKLNDEIVLKIKNDARNYVEIAKDLGVWPTTIGDIKTGKTWKHIK